MKRLIVNSSKGFTRSYCADEIANKTHLKSNLFRIFPNLSEAINGKRVLEIGCTDGKVLEELRNYGANAIGIDLFVESKKPYLLKGDFMNYPLDTFDFIIALGVFEKCALYSPQLLSYDLYQQEMLEQNSPDKILIRLKELLAINGICIFNTYAQNLMFTKEMASDFGFKLRKIRVQINTERYGRFEYNGSIIFKPIDYYLMESV